MWGYLGSLWASCLTGELSMGEKKVRGSPSTGEGLV